MTWTEFLTKTKLRPMRMFSHGIVLWAGNPSLITGVRCVLAQLELWNVFEGQTEWTFKAISVFECGAVFHRTAALLVQFVKGCETSCLWERASRLATLNHTTISEEHGEKRGIDLVIYLGGTLHLWAQEFTDISRGWHCLTLKWLEVSQVRH